MAEVTKATVASFDSSDPNLKQIAGDLFFGEDCATGDLGYISPTDGKVYRSSGAAANAAAKCPRLIGVGGKANRPATLYMPGARFKGANSGLTPGAIYYLSATVPGGLATAATTGDANGTVQAVSDTDVVLIRWL